MRLPSTSSKAGSSVWAYCWWATIDRSPALPTSGYCEDPGTSQPDSTKFCSISSRVIFLSSFLLVRRRGSRSRYIPALLRCFREIVSMLEARVPRRTLLGSSVNRASLLQTIKTPACSEDMRRQYPLRLLGCFLFPFLCFLFCCLRAFSCFICHPSLLLFRNTAETLPAV
jgi:hypothetical protein